MIPVIDVSSNNQALGDIDWPTVAKYLLNLHPEAAVIVKVNQGLTYVNEDFHAQRMGAHAAGIKNVGLYDYCTPSRNSGSKEAEFFLKCIGDEGGVLAGEFYMLDNEDPNVLPDADLDAFTLDWLGVPDRADGLRPFHYSAHYYMAPHNLEVDPRLARYPLAYASYQDTIPPIPKPWSKISLWQYSANGTVPGIRGPVDLSWFMGDIDELHQYQWGFQPDPIKQNPDPIDPPIDIDLPNNSESVQDMHTMFQHIADLAKAQSLWQIKADADWGVRASWGH